MTQTEKIIALAELEGWTNVEFCPADIDGPEIYQGKQNGQWHECKPYLTSHDALQPLLDKMTEKQWREFGCLTSDMPYQDPNFPSLPKKYLTLTPEQKADCILKACGKWKE